MYLTLDLPDDFETIQGDVHETIIFHRLLIVDSDFDKPDCSDII